VSTEFLLPVRVYIEDTDAGGIVYYVNYLKYFERCRTELMRALGTERAAISESGWMFVVAKLSVSYRQPAHLDDELHATALITAVGGATIGFFQSVRRGETVLVEGDMQIACVDCDTGRPRRLPHVLRRQADANLSAQGDRA
jgi:tol-pal system-associated acyl-CoA thioesterase